MRIITRGRPARQEGKGNTQARRGRAAPRRRLKPRLGATTSACADSQPPCGRGVRLYRRHPCRPALRRQGRRRYKQEAGVLGVGNPRRWVWWRPQAAPRRDFNRLGGERGFNRRPASRWRRERAPPRPLRRALSRAGRPQRPDHAQQRAPPPPLHRRQSSPAGRCC